MKWHEITVPLVRIFLRQLITKRGMCWWKSIWNTLQWNCNFDTKFLFLSPKKIIQAFCEISQKFLWDVDSGFRQQKFQFCTWIWTCFYISISSISIPACLCQTSRSHPISKLSHASRPPESRPQSQFFKFVVLPIPLYPHRPTWCPSEHSLIFYFLVWRSV